MTFGHAASAYLLLGLVVAAVLWHRDADHRDHRRGTFYEESRADPANRLIPDSALKRAISVNELAYALWDVVVWPCKLVKLNTRKRRK